MPEGHTIFRAAAQHRRHLVGREIVVSSPQGRFAEEAAVLAGGEIDAVEAHGKHLFQIWDDDHVVHIHLGLFGRFRLQRTPEPDAPRGQVRVRWTTAQATIDLSGPTICALIDRRAMEQVRSRLGPDPLHPDADAERFVTRVRRSSSPIGRLLMDQSVVAGVGNVYRAEVLHMLRIDPRRAGKTLSDEEVQAIWDLLVRLLAEGARRGSIVTAALDDPELPRRARGVYRRSTCQRCGGPVRKELVAGRNLFLCPACQR